jgi:RNA polymerase sigma factor (sigma-70 family)
MDNDTDLGGPADGFPVTRHSLVRAAGSPDEAARTEAFANLIAAYWKPVYKYLRVRWKLSNEDAKDRTQAFFTEGLEKDFFTRFDPTRARFRTFLRVCVDGFAAKERRAAGAQKRGGGMELLSLDVEDAEGELHRYAVADARDPDEFFRQEWVRGLVALAVEDVRCWSAAAGTDTHFALFCRYDLEGPETPAGLTYERLAEEFGLSVSQVTNHLALVRRQFRRRLLDRLRTSTGSEEEFRAEAGRLFGEGVA